MSMKWLRDLRLVDMNFEVDSKVVEDNIYGKKDSVSDFGAIINDCKRLLSMELVNLHVRFIRRQVNETTHSLARVIPSLVSSHIFTSIPTFIQTIILNDMT